MTVRMQYHGGGCCGVTHLYLGETAGPKSRVSASKKFDYKKLAETAVPKYLNFNTNLGNGTYYAAIGYREEYGYEAPAMSLDRPEETAGERAKALLDKFKKSGRTSGLIEAVITNIQIAWGPWLEEQGFKRVASAKNSNSGNVVSFYVLAYGSQTDIIPAPEEPPEYDGEGDDYISGSDYNGYDEIEED